LEILDIGGGFPVAYRDGVCTADDIIESIRTLLAPHVHRLTVLAEPGRYVVASSMTLITTVIGAGTRQTVPWYYLDGGVYGGNSNVAWEDVHPPILSLDELWEHRTPNWHNRFTRRRANAHKCIILQTVTLSRRT
jgi:ornithine decarboxylase